MNRLIAIFAAAALLAHSLIGCCWHHAHQSRVEANPPGHGHLAGACESHHHHACVPGGESSDENDGHEPCDETDCVFVRADGPNGAYLQDSFEVDLPAVASQNGALAGQAAPWFGQPESAGPRPPSRLHLLHQVLLI